MAAANNEFFEALSMLEHERGITAEYLIDKIKAAIVIAVKKNYEVEDNNVMVEIDPANGKFNVALIQDVVADEDWYDEHSEIGITEAQNIRKDYKVGDRVVTPLKTKDFGRIAAQTAKHDVMGAGLDLAQLLAALGLADALTDDVLCGLCGDAAKVLGLEGSDHAVAHLVILADVLGLGNADLAVLVVPVLIGHNILNESNVEFAVGGVDLHHDQGLWPHRRTDRKARHP